MTHKIEETRKCPSCNRTKKLRLFSKKKCWCKACEKRAVNVYRSNLKEEDFHKWKSYQFRSNWRRRAKQQGADLTTVPTIKEIQKWLESQYPYKCYFTGESLDRQFGVDHIVPVSRGGTFDLKNLCITSPFINGAKGTMTETEFKALLKLIWKWEDKGKQLLQRLVVSNTRTFTKGSR